MKYRIKEDKYENGSSIFFPEIGMYPSDDLSGHLHYTWYPLSSVNGIAHGFKEYTEALTIIIEYKKAHTHVETIYHDIE